MIASGSIRVHVYNGEVHYGEPIMRVGNRMTLKFDNGDTYNFDTDTLCVISSEGVQSDSMMLNGRDCSFLDG